MGVLLMGRSYGNPCVCGYRYRTWHMGQPHKLYASTNHYRIVLFPKITHFVTYRWIDQITTLLTRIKNNTSFNAWVSDQNSVFGDICESVILDCTCHLEFVVSKSQGQATLDFTSDLRLTKSDAWLLYFFTRWLKRVDHSSRRNFVTLVGHMGAIGPSGIHYLSRKMGHRLTHTCSRRARKSTTLEP